MKKGFTLIELLAIIVILAIIALIATPIVLSIIEEIKESAILRSTEHYLSAVEHSIAKKSLSIGGSFSPNICEVQDDENLLCDEKDTLEVEVSGEVPSSGTITFENGKIKDVTFKYSKGIVMQNGQGKLVLKEIVTLANNIKNLYSETKTATVNGIEYSLDETHLLMNDRLGSSEVAKLDGNIRYYGANPNNYVDIGDRDSDGNIIFWRIIGLFKDIEVTDEAGNVIKTEDLVKIIRADKLTSGDISGFSWDYTESGSYDNNWKDSTLQLMLNDETNGYYASRTPTYYNGSTTPVTFNFTSTGLSSTTHSKVARVNWSIASESTDTTYTDEMYAYERNGTNKWSGKIALMYSSDYGYSVNLKECQSNLSGYDSSKCKNTSWMYDSTKTQWTLTPFIFNTRSVYFIHSTGYLSSRSPDGVNYAFDVRPVMYLKSDIGVVEEKETSEGIKYLVLG